MVGINPVGILLFLGLPALSLIGGLWCARAWQRGGSGGALAGALLCTTFGLFCALALEPMAFNYLRIAFSLHWLIVPPLARRALGGSAYVGIRAFIWCLAGTQIFETFFGLGLGQYGIAWRTVRPPVFFFYVLQYLNPVIAGAVYKWGKERRQVGLHTTRLETYIRGFGLAFAGVLAPLLLNRAVNLVSRFRGESYSEVVWTAELLVHLLASALLPAAVGIWAATRKLPAAD